MVMTHIRPSFMMTFEVLGGVGNQVHILQRIAFDQQQIGERALFDDAKLPPRLPSNASSSTLVPVAIGCGRAWCMYECM
jgi:hypothetical protein